MDWVEEFFDGEFYAQDYLEVAQDTERTGLEVQFICNQMGLSLQDTVLDLACGSGRHALALSPLVKKVVGIDRTKAVIGQAVNAAKDIKLDNVEFHLGDMRQLAFENQFDAAYNYFTAWGYYNDEANFDVLRRVCRALKPGGRFLLEILHRDAVMRKFRPYDWHKHEDGTYVMHKRSVDFSKGRFHSTYIHLKNGKEQSIEIDHYIPSCDALVRHFKDAGFSNVRLVAAPDGGEVGLDTWRIAVIGYV